MKLFYENDDCNFNNSKSIAGIRFNPLTPLAAAEI